MSTIGSQRLLQETIRNSSQFIDPELRTALGLSNSIEINWRSPIASTDYKEYRDKEVLALLGVTLETLPLSEFWPARGPVWDGLARSASGEIVLVEAKAHIAEIASPGTGATEDSLKKIEAAFQRVRDEIASRSSASWTSTFYQYANRLAFLYLLRTNNVDAHVVHVLYLNARDVGGPSSIDEWRGALELLRSALGLRSHSLKPFVHEIYIDARPIEASIHRALAV